MDASVVEKINEDENEEGSENMESPGK